jgi:uncharacterized protein involved in outer membrane biogenesis
MIAHMTSSTAARRRIHPVLLIAIVLVGLVLIVWAVVAIAFPPSRVRAIVQAQLSGALAREVRYGDARIAVFPPVRLSVIDPALAEPGGFARGAMFRARAVHLDLDVMALLGRRIVVRRLVLEQPQIHLVLRADGTTNLDGIVKEQPASAKASKPMDLEVRELAVRDGRLLVDDMKSARRTAFGIGSQVNLTSEAGGTRFSIDGDTRISDLAFGPLAARNLADLNNSLAKLDWRIEHRGKFDATQKRLALERLSVAFDRTELEVSGLIDDPGPTARLDLKVRGAGLDLGQIAGFLAAADASALNGIDADGRLDLDLAVRGALGHPTPPAVTGVLRIADGAFRYPGAPAGVQALALSARFAPDSVIVNDIHARVTSGTAAQPVLGRLLVTRLTDPLIAFALRGDVDLAAIGPMVAPKQTKLAGNVAVDVRGNGRAADPAGMALDGQAVLREVSVEGAGLPKKVEHVGGTVTFSPARATVRALTAQAGGSSLTLDASVARPLALLAAPHSTPPTLVDFSLHSPNMDLAELLPVTPGAPLLPNATGGGRIEIARLRQQKLDVRDVRAQVSLDPGTLSVPAFSCDGYGGKVTGNAKFDLTDPKLPVFAVKARVDSAQANDILSAWTPLKNLFQGSLSSSLDLSGAGMTPEVIARTVSAAGLAGIVNGTFGPTPVLEAIAKAIRLPSGRVTKLRDMKLPFQVQQGRVYTDRGTLRTEYGDWVLTGSSGFDGSIDYALSGTLPKALVKGPEASSLIGAGALTDKDGNLLLDLKLGGTAKQPRVGIDTGAMKDRLAGKVSDTITEQRQKIEQQLRDALLQRQQATTDSARKAAAQNEKAIADSLRRSAQDLFKGFFGKKKKPETKTTAENDSTP